MRKFLPISLICLISLIWPMPAFAAASLSLSPASATKSVGTTFNVDIIVDTGGDATGGVTAILTYDTTKLSVSGSALTPGPIFGSSVAPFTNTVDATTGQIRYDSGTLGTPYTGRGTLATITFRTVAAGSAAVNFVYNPSSTTGTSLVAASTGPTSLLSTVNNGIYTITSGAVTTTLLPTGAVENTIAMVLGGLVFVIVGIYLGRKAFLQ